MNREGKIMSSKKCLVSTIIKWLSKISHSVFEFIRLQDPEYQYLSRAKDMADLENRFKLMKHSYKPTCVGGRGNV